MWLALFSFLGGPVIRGLIDAYNAHLKATTDDKAIASDLAGKEIAAQADEIRAGMQYRIAELGYWYEPDKIMGYCVAAYLAKLLIWDKVLGFGTTDPLTGWVETTSNLVVVSYFGKRTFENVARIIRR